MIVCELCVVAMSVIGSADKEKDVIGPDVDAYICMLSKLYSCGMVHATNITALNTKWMTSTDGFFPAAGALYVFPRAKASETNVTCVQVRYDRNTTSINGPDATVELYAKGRLVVTFASNNFDRSTPVRWRMSFPNGGNEKRFVMGAAKNGRGKFEVGFPYPDKCISCVRTVPKGQGVAKPLLQGGGESAPKQPTEVQGDASHIEEFINRMQREQHVEPFNESHLSMKKPTYIQTVVLTLAMFLNDNRDAYFVSDGSFPSSALDSRKSLRVNYQSFDESSVNQYLKWLLKSIISSYGSYELSSDPPCRSFVNVRNAFTRLVSTSIKQ